MPLRIYSDDASSLSTRLIAPSKYRNKKGWQRLRKRIIDLHNPHLVASVWTASTADQTSAARMATNAGTSVIEQELTCPTTGKTTKVVTIVSAASCSEFDFQSIGLLPMAPTLLTHWYWNGIHPPHPACTTDLGLPADPTFTKGQDETTQSGLNEAWKRWEQAPQQD